MNLKKRFSRYKVAIYENQNIPCLVRIYDDEKINEHFASLQPLRGVRKKCKPLRYKELSLRFRRYKGVRSTSAGTRAQAQVKRVLILSGKGLIGKTLLPLEGGRQ